MVHKLIILQWACGLVWVTHMVKMLSLSYTAVALHSQTLKSACLKVKTKAR